MYLVEQPYINHNSNRNKNLVNNNHQQIFNNGTLDSPLSSQSISSCELANIEQNLSPSCNNLQMTNNNFNCDTDCLLTNINQQQQQQLNNYQSNSFINYSDEKSNCKLKVSQLSTNKTLNQTMLNDADLQGNYDYMDNKFDKFENLFCWNSNESINNLASYTDQLDANTDCDYFLLNRSNPKHDLNQIESDLNLAPLQDQQTSLNRQHLNSKISKQIDKKNNLLTASESQQLAELLTLNDLNSTPLENSMQLESNQFEQTTRPTWQQRSIFDWSTQDQTDFLYSIALQYSYPIEDLRAYFLCYSPIQLANMDKDQMCCINSKYGSTIHQAINLFKANFNNSFSENYFNQQQQQNPNYQPSNIVQQPNCQMNNSTKQISTFNNENNLNHNQSNSYSTNLPSFDLLCNSCYDLDSTDQSPSSLSDSDRDSTSSSMTAVNEHLNRQMISTTNQPQIISNDNELFGLSATSSLTNSTDGHNRQNSINHNQHQFHPHSNQVIQNLNSTNLTNLTNLTNVTNLPNCLNDNGSFEHHQKNTVNNTIDNIKKELCDLNNNTINTNGLITEQTNRSLNRSIQNDSQNMCMNMNLNNLHQPTINVHSQSNFINKPNDNLTNCQSFDTFHSLNADRSVNANNSINKLNVSGRRGRPPKKDSQKSRSRQNRGKTNGKLWEFIRDLLLDEGAGGTNPAFIRWERKEDGVFKFVQSDKVAKLWGQRKQNPRMTYEKLSRAMRYYYKSQVLLPVFGRRLVYKFGPNATGWFK